MIECLKQQKNLESPVFTLVIPTRNRYGARMRNCMRGIQLQTQKGIEVVIADYGSSKKGLERTLKTLEPFDCTVYHYKTGDVWSLSRARNIGIRRANAKYVASLDVDCIMEPDVVKTSVIRYEENPNYFVVSRVCHCPKDLDVKSLVLPQDYQLLRGRCECVRPGVGAYMSAPREWWFKVRGFDERMKRWGAEDDDIKKRARKDGRHLHVLSRKKDQGRRIYHQWHPKSGARLNSRRQQRINLRIFKKDNTLIRNKENWGYASN